MNENNFNVCNRCGSANPLSARYCYQCGFELKNPEEPVVCTKCNTVNQGSANFCKRCGSKLPKAQSKTVCPQCSASNNVGTVYCVNCGYDFTAHLLPSAVEVSQAQRQQIASSTSVVVTKAQDQKLSRKEKKKLKREEEERAYREQMQARKEAKLQKKEEKKLAKQQAKTPQPQAQQMPQYPQVVSQPMVQQPMAQQQMMGQQMMPQMGYMPPVVQQIVVEQPKQKPKKHRIKNLIVFLIALVGLYLILMPEQLRFIKDLGVFLVYSGNDVMLNLTGWDIVVSVLSNFVPSIASLSSIAVANKLTSIELLITGILLAVVTLYLVCYILAKLLGILTGKAHQGVDVGAIVMMLITGGAFAYVYVSGIHTITISIYALVVPVVFLAIAIFNSKIRKD